MPSGPLAHISFIVNDLDQAIENWTKILKILDPAQLEERIVRYDGFEGGGDRMRSPIPTAPWAAGWPSTARVSITSASPSTAPRTRWSRLRPPA